MRSQATRNTDLIAAQNKRKKRRELALAIPVITIFAFTIAYAVVGLVSP